MTTDEKVDLLKRSLTQELGRAGVFANMYMMSEDTWNAGRYDGIEFAFKQVIEFMNELEL